MNVDEAEVERIARLAHLRFSPAERQRMSEQMSAILGYIDQLAGVHTALLPEPDPSDAASRADRASASLPREVVAENAPAITHGFFVVPQVLAGGEK